MAKKINSVRTDLYSNKQFNMDQLTRLVKVNNKLVVDSNKKMLGRGYWIKVDDTSINDPKLLTILSKRTKCSLDETFLEQLKKCK